MELNKYDVVFTVRPSNGKTHHNHIQCSQAGNVRSQLAFDVNDLALSYSSQSGTAIRDNSKIYKRCDIRALPAYLQAIPELLRKSTFEDSSSSYKGKPTLEAANHQYNRDVSLRGNVDGQSASIVSFGQMKNDHARERAFATEREHPTTWRMANDVQGLEPTNSMKAKSCSMITRLHLLSEYCNELRKEENPEYANIMTLLSLKPGLIYLRSQFITVKLLIYTFSHTIQVEFSIFSMGLIQTA